MIPRIKIESERARQIRMRLKVELLWGGLGEINQKRYTKMAQELYLTHTQTHKHKQTQTYTHRHTLSLSHTHTHTFSLFNTHTDTLIEKNRLMDEFQLVRTWKVCKWPECFQQIRGFQWQLFVHVDVERFASYFIFGHKSYSVRDLDKLNLVMVVRFKAWANFPYYPKLPQKN